MARKPRGQGTTGNGRQSGRGGTTGAGGMAPMLGNQGSYTSLNGLRNAGKQAPQVKLDGGGKS